MLYPNNPRNTWNTPSTSNSYTCVVGLLGNADKKRKPPLAGLVSIRIILYFPLVNEGLH
jgi:hypothetical protein